MPKSGKTKKRKDYRKKTKIRRKSNKRTYRRNKKRLKGGSRSAANIKKRENTTLSKGDSVILRDLTGDHVTLNGLNGTIISVKQNGKHKVKVHFLGVVGPTGRIYHLKPGNLEKVVKQTSAERWDSYLFRLEDNIEDKQIVNSVAFSPKGEMIVSGDANNMVRVWNEVTGECLQALRGHSREVNSVQFSPDGQKIVSSSADGTLRVWNVVSGRCEQVGRCLADGQVNSAQFSPNSQLVLSGHEDYKLQLWDVEGGRLLWSMRMDGGVNYAQFDPHGDKIVVATSTYPLRMASVPTMHSRHKVQVYSVRRNACVEGVILNGHSDRIFTAKFSPDGQKIVTASMDETVRIWNANTGGCLQVLTGLDNNNHSTCAYSAEFSPKGDKIVAGCNNTVCVWSAETGEMLREKPQVLEHTAPVYSVSFSPNGEKIVSAGRDDQGLKVWSRPYLKKLAFATGDLEGNNSSPLLYLDDSKVYDKIFELYDSLIATQAMYITKKYLRFD